MKLDTESKIRLAEPRDASYISSLFKEGYCNYPFKEFLDPNGYREILKREDSIAWVADNNGEVRGHAAVVRLEEGTIGEFGRLVVSQNHRNKGIATRLVGRQTAYAKANGMTLGYAMTVTSHNYSQRVYESQGFIPAGIEIGKFPDILGNGQRESVFLHVIDVNGLIGNSKKDVFLPERYHSFADAIYTRFGCERNIKNVDVSLSPESDVKLSVNDTLKSSKLEVRKVGSDIKSEIAEKVKDLDIEYSSIDVILDETAPFAIRNLNDIGYGISSIFPCYKNGSAERNDIARMQRISDRSMPIFSRIKSASRFGEFLREFVEEDLRKVQKGA